MRLSVQDRGIGIPARDLDRIFERFYRVDHGRSRDTGGTGLGLSIVRHVANNHQGWVDVESREGEGSTFSLVLPLQTERLVVNKNVHQEQDRQAQRAARPRARDRSRSCWPRTRSPSSTPWSSGSPTRGSGSSWRGTGPRRCGSSTRPIPTSSCST